MKALIIISGVVLGIIVGILPGNDKSKPLLWKLFAIFFTIILIIISFLPPIAANFSTVKYISNIDNDYVGNVLANVTDKQNYDETSRTWNIYIWQDEPNNSEILKFKGEQLPDEFKANNKLVLKLKYEPEAKVFHYISTVSVNPILTFPVVPGLEEQIRIMNFHVPVAWIAVLAYLFSMVYAIQYLRKKDFNYDLKATASAEIGLIFTILATVTGMIWAKLNWGSFWNWDPRQTSIFILMLIYAAYFALRASLDSDELKARLGSVYSIIAFITVPFLIFILPRLLDGLHPGSDNDNTTGPILSPQKDTLNFLQQISFSMGFAAFSLIFFWLLNIRYRVKKLQFFK